MAAEEAADISGGAITKAPGLFLPHEGNVCIDLVGDDFLLIALLVFVCVFLVLAVCVHLCLHNNWRLGSHMSSLVRSSRCMASGMLFM